MANLSNIATLDTTDYIAGINKMKQETSSFTNSVVRESEKIDSSLRALGTGLAAYFSIDAAKGFTSQLIRVRGEFQQLEIGLNTMLGSKAKADALMADVVEFASKTPFELQQVAAGTKQLIAYGVASETVVDTLRRLGDISSGLNIPLQDLTYLYGTTLVQGRLYAQDMMQFSNRGIPLIQELSKQFGVTTAQVKDLVSEGKVGFPEVEKAILAMTDAGGKFAGLTEKNSQSLTGLVSNFQDTVTNAYNTIGERSEDTLANMVKFGTSVVEHWEDIAKALGVVITAVGSYKAAIIATAVYQKVLNSAANAKAWFELAKGIRTSKDAMTAFNLTCKANPLVLVISLLSSATAAFLLYNNSLKESEEATNAVSEAQKKADEEFTKQAAKIDSLRGILDSETASLNSKKKALQDLKSLIPEYNASLSEEGVLINNNKTAIDNYLQSLEKQIKLKAAQEELEEAYRQKRELERRREQEAQDLSEASSKLNSAKLAAASRAQGLGTSGSQIFVTASDPSVNIFKEEQAKAREALELTDDALLKVNRDISALTEEINSSAISTDSSTKEFKDFSTQLAEAQQKVASLKEDLENLRSGKTVSQNYIADIAQKEKELKEAENNVALLLNKKASSSVYVDTYKKGLSDANTRKGIEDAARSLQRSITQTEIDAMKEGTAKKLAQLKFNYEEEKFAIKEQEQNLLLMLQDEERKRWEEQNPDFQKKNLQFTPTITSLPENLSSLIEARSKQADEAYIQAQRNLLQDVLSQYQDFNKQREVLEKDFNTTLSYLNSQRTEENAEEIDRATDVLKKKYEERLKQINESELNVSKQDSDFLKNLFGDYASKGYYQFVEMVDKARALRDYLSGKGNDEEVFSFISKETLELIKNSPADLEALKKALESLLSVGKYGSSDLGKIISDFESGLEKINSADGNLNKMADGFSSIAKAASSATSYVSSFLSSLSETEAGESLEGISQVFNSISNIAKGFAQGGVVGAIVAAVGEVLDLIVQAVQASERESEFYEELGRRKIEQQREYNLLLMQQNLLYEKATSIFGTDSYAKAVNAVNALKEAQKELNESLRADPNRRGSMSISSSVSSYQRYVNELKQAYKGLASVQIETGWERTGLFGWGKGRATYSSVLDVYPELISANGEFNTSLAETILNTQNMTDSSRQALQYFVDLAKQAEAAAEEISAFFTEIFGSLGSNFASSIIDAFRNGEDAADSFADHVEKMLEDLAEQMIYSIALAPAFEEAQKQMEEIMKNPALSDEEKFEQWSSVLSSLIGDLAENEDTTNALLEKLKEVAAENGFDIFQPDYDQSASRGFSATMSQELGESLEGRFTAIQMNTASILTFIIEMKSLMLLELNHLASIDKYIKVISNSFTPILSKIEKNTSNL